MDPRRPTPPIQFIIPASQSFSHPYPVVFQLEDGTPTRPVPVGWRVIRSRYLALDGRVVYTFHPDQRLDVSVLLDLLCVDAPVEWFYGNGPSSHDRLIAPEAVDRFIMTELLVAEDQ